MVIDPVRHALLHDVAQGAQWVGTDEFPSCAAWAEEHEAWLQFVKGECVLAASYDREGDDLVSRGLYLDLRPWSCHVFGLTVL